MIPKGNLSVHPHEPGGILPLVASRSPHTGNPIRSSVHPHEPGGWGSWIPPLLPISLAL